MGLKSEENASTLGAESPTSGLLWSLNDWLSSCSHEKLRVVKKFQLINWLNIFIICGTFFTIISLK